MQQEKLQYIIELVKQGSTTDAVSELQKLDGAQKKASESAEELAGKFKKAIAAIAGAYVIRESIKAFEEKTKAINLLNGALQASGKYSAEYSRDLQNLAGKMGDLAKVEDDMVLAGERILVQFRVTRQEMPRMVQAMMDLAAAGYGVESSASALGAAFSGQMEPLRRMLRVEIPDGANRFEQFNFLLQTVEQRFRGMAAANAVSASGLKELKLATRELQEDLGRLLSSAMRPMVNQLTAATQATHEWASETETSRPVIIGALAGIGTAVAALSAGYLALAANAARAGSAMSFGALGKMAGSMGRALTAGGGMPAIGIAGGVAAGSMWSEADLMRQAMAGEADSEEALRGSQTSRYEYWIQELEQRIRDGRMTEEKSLELSRILDRAFTLTRDVVIRQNALNMVMREAGGIPAGTPADEGFSGTIYDPEFAARRMQWVNREVGIAEAGNFGRGRVYSPMGLIGLKAGQQRDMIEYLGDMGYLQSGEAISQISGVDYAEQIARAQQARTGFELARGYQYKPGSRAGELAEIDRQYAEKMQVVAEYYAWEREKAGDNEDYLKQLAEEEKNVTANMLTERRQKTSEWYRDIQQLELGISQTFAQGFSQAFVEFIQGTKSAGQAFQEFGANFLSTVAQMIMQMLILKALKGVFGLGMADGGMIMAANGVAGVTEVNSPTYFPRFNVLAGEAGREMMTVMARPQSVVANGIPAIIGDVQGSRLALMNAGNVNRWANGGSTGSLNFGGGGGVAEIRIRLEPGLKAQITDNAIEGAMIRVVSDLNQDTPVSSAVKQLTK